MPIRNHIPNIEAIKAEVEALEKQRSILKSPEMIAALKAEVSGLAVQRLKTLTEIDEAKTILANIRDEQTQAVLTEIAEMKQKARIESQKIVENANIEAYSDLSQAKAEEQKIKDKISELTNKNAELKNIASEMASTISGLEKQKETIEKHTASVMAKAEENAKELNDRRNAYKVELEALKEAISEQKRDVEQALQDLAEKEQAILEREKVLNQQSAILKEAEDRRIKEWQAKEADLKLEYDKLNVRRDVLVAKEAASDEWSRLLAAQKTGLVKLKSELDLLEQKLIQDRQDIVSKWDEILKREADLETNWKVYAGAKKKFDLKLKNLGG